jgi:predicted nucleic acid-binding protein
LYRAPASLSLYRRALDLQTRYHYGFYDSLIIAAALDAGCTRLYSEDLQDGQQIEGLTIRDPFSEL